MLYRLFFLFQFIFISAFANPNKYVDIGAKVFKHNDKSILALSFQNKKDWHTYWKNPGDAGLAIKTFFKVDESETKLNDYPWPAPKRYIEQGNLWAYGYSGDYALFFDIPKSLYGKKLSILAKWLVCKNICLDEQKEITVQISNEGTGNNSSLLNEDELITIFNDLPQVAETSPLNFFLYKTENENELALVYMIEGADFNSLPKKHNIVTPYQAFPLTFKHEEIFLDKENQIIYGRFLLDWDGIYEDPELPLPKSGEFAKPISMKYLVQYPQGKKNIISRSFSQFSVNGYDQLKSTLGGLKKSTIEASSQKIKASSIFKYILFAFLGGLILNLMPCVLPVISLKLFGLIIHSDESKKSIFKHNMFYTLGVLISFMVLATLVFALKMSGEQIGWGFQLQSALFVFFMLVLIYIMALNMLGLFEFVTPGGKTLGNKQIKKGVWGDFTNGVLATILSTPCSAPFLGSALPFAFTTTTLNIYLIFSFVGIGLAFPFILTAFFPAMIKFLPKPGLWMDKLKKLLGLTLLLTAVWLYDVLAGLMNLGHYGIYINTVLVMIFFGFYFRKSISKNILMNFIAFLIPLLLVINLLNESAFSTKPNTSSQVQTGQMKWLPWSQDQMKKVKSSEGYAFINFTASWCLTCKVNKKLVLETEDFQEIVTAKKMTLLEGDWTKRDDKITQFLRSHNIVGVPAYFMIKPDGQVISLGETISIGKIKKNL